METQESYANVGPILDMQLLSIHHPSHPSSDLALCFTIAYSRVFKSHSIQDAVEFPVFPVWRNTSSRGPADAVNDEGSPYAQSTLTSIPPTEDASGVILPVALADCCGTMMTKHEFEANYCSVEITVRKNNDPRAIITLQRISNCLIGIRVR